MPFWPAAPLESACYSARAGLSRGVGYHISCMGHATKGADAKPCRVPSVSGQDHRRNRDEGIGNRAQAQPVVQKRHMHESQHCHPNRQHPYRHARARAIGPARDRARHAKQNGKAGGNDQDVGIKRHMCDMGARRDHAKWLVRPCYIIGGRAVTTRR